MNNNMIIKGQYTSAEIFTENIEDAIRLSRG